MRAKVAHGGIDQVARGVAEQRLPAVGCGGDPRCPMDVVTDVAGVGQHRLPSVEPDPHANRAIRQSSLCGTGGRDSVRSACKRDEERIALRVHFDALVPLP